MTAYWIKNTQGCVIDVSALRDVNKQPLVWRPAGDPQSWRCVDAATVAHGIVQHLLLTRQVIPDPIYDAAASRRDPAAVAAEYDAAFGKAVSAAPPAAPGKAEAEAAAKAEAEAAAAKAEAEAAAAKAEAEAAAKAEAEAAAKAEAEAAAKADTPETPKNKHRKGR